MCSQRDGRCVLFVKRPHKSCSLSLHKNFNTARKGVCGHCSRHRAHFCGLGRIFRPPPTPRTDTLLYVWPNFFYFFAPSCHVWRRSADLSGCVMRTFTRNTVPDRLELIYLHVAVFSQRGEGPLLAFRWSLDVMRISRRVSPPDARAWLK